MQYIGEKWKQCEMEWDLKFKIVSVLIIFELRPAIIYWVYRTVLKEILFYECLIDGMKT